VVDDQPGPYAANRRAFRPITRRRSRDPILEATQHVATVTAQILDVEQRQVTGRPRCRRRRILRTPQAGSPNSGTCDSGPSYAGCRSRRERAAAVQSSTAIQVSVSGVGAPNPALQGRQRPGRPCVALKPNHLRQNLAGEPMEFRYFRRRRMVCNAGSKRRVAVAGSRESARGPMAALLAAPR